MRSLASDVIVAVLAYGTRAVATGDLGNRVAAVEIALHEFHLLCALVLAHTPIRSWGSDIMRLISKVFGND